MASPYRRVHTLIAARQGGWLRSVVPVLAALLAGFLLQGSLFSFLQQGELARGAAGAALRVSMVVLGVLALRQYSDLVRGPDRAVLDCHPIQPRRLLLALAQRSLTTQLPVLLAGVAVQAPVLVAGQGEAFGAGVALVAGTWLAALTVPYGVYLGAVWAARSPSMEALLEAARGDNAPMHAALLYAPGIVAGVVGFPLSQSALVVEGILGGWTGGWVWLLLLPGLAAAGLAAALPLADRYYVSTTALLTEMDGQYAGIAEADESGHVYLEWTATGRPELLRALRQAGRRLWPYSVGAWTGGALAALAAWTRAGGETGWMLLLVTGGAVLIGTMPAALAAGDPPWLDRALGVSRARVGAARATAAVLYAQGLLVLPLFALILREGVAALVPLLLAELLVVVTAVLSATAAARFGARAGWIVGPFALVLWAAALSAPGAA